MLLFKPEHVEPILAGRKTQTRRVWKRCRVNVGAVHKCYWQMPITGGHPFARVEILNVRRERLLSISDADAGREGYPSRTAYVAAFRAINARRRVKANPLTWVVDFRLVA